MATLYGLANSTAATSEPVTVEEARKQVELPAAYTAHDAHLSRLIVAARQRAELVTGRALITSTWDLYLDMWPDYGSCSILLPKPPLQSVTSITYVDGNGATQTWSSANYVVSTSREPGRVALAYGASYPSIRYQPDSIRVRYVAGYGVASAVPQAIKAAILLLVAHWFGNREDAVIGTISSELPTASRALLEQYTVGDEFVAYGGLESGVI